MAEFIDRAAALSFPFATGEYDREHADPHFINGCETYKEWIEGLPAADVAPVVHAHWINPSQNPSISNRDFFFDCSACGITKMDETDYCPACGAIMDERSEDNG